MSLAVGDGSSRIFHVAAVLELGALFGALASGILADRFSRRHSIFFACGMPVYQCTVHLFFLRSVLYQSYFALAPDYNVVPAP